MQTALLVLHYAWESPGEHHKSFNQKEKKEGRKSGVPFTAPLAYYN